MGLSVGMVVADGVTVFEVAAACEVFGVERPELGVDWYDFGVFGAGAVEFGGWFRVEPGRGLEGLVEADTVIVPGCRDVERPPDGDVVAAVRAAHEAGARVVSLCTGAFVLAAAGLLDGRRATTHWVHADVLARRYPSVKVDPDVLYIDDGDVLTSAGKAAGMDLCLHVVRCDYGSAVANALARRLVVPPQRAGGQAQFIPAPVSHGREHPLAELFPWVTERLDQPLTVEDMARRAHMSSRNLARHFRAVTGTTPLQWLLTQRVHRARELLETTDESVDLIAGRTGLGTATTLRRHFHRTVGVSPDAYRRMFQ
jgi:AraC family transcriptional regulator, transcriptional activator FtrA